MKQSTTGVTILQKSVSMIT